MSTSLVRHIASFMDQYPDIAADASVLVALSGGGDSVALAHVLSGLGFQVAVAHVNYGLRAEAAAETAWVAQWAQEQGWPCHVRHEVPGACPEGASFQAWAREVRYGWMEDLRATYGYPWLATGHHRQDRLETLLWSLLRGGRPGQLQDLAGRRGPVIRPLIQVDKSTLEAYLADHGLTFFHDSSNDKADYLRNQLRLRVWPELTAVNPSFGDRLLAVAEEMSQRADHFQDLAGNIAADPRLVEFCAGDWHIYSDRFGEGIFQDHFPRPHPRNARLFLESWLPERGLFGAEIQRVLQLLDSAPGAALVLERDGEPGKVLRIKGGLKIRMPGERRYDDSFAPQTIDSTDMAADQPLIRDFGRYRMVLELVPVPDDLVMTGGREVHWLSLEELEWPLTVRPWRPGDRMQPLGMQGHKLLSDVFSDAGVPTLDRKAALVVEAGKGEIVLLSGFRIADRVRVRPGKEQVLRVEICRL